MFCPQFVLHFYITRTFYVPGIAICVYLVIRMYYQIASFVSSEILLTDSQPSLELVFLGSQPQLDEEMHLCKSKNQATPGSDRNLPCVKVKRPIGMMP